jgi:hypothetical protein
MAILSWRTRPNAAATGALLRNGEHEPLYARRPKNRDALSGFSRRRIADGPARFFLWRLDGRFFRRWLFSLLRFACRVHVVGCVSTYSEAVEAAEKNGQNDPVMVKIPDNWEPRVFSHCA